MAGTEAKTGPAFAGLRFLGLLSAFAPAQAFASAWIAPEEGQEIWTNVAGARDGVSFAESSAYWEVPTGEDDAFVAAPWVETNYDTEDGWRAETTIGVKHAVSRSERGVSAVQAGALWVSHPQEGCGEGGAEVRWLAGRSVGETGFLNVEAAGRALSGGCEGARLDVTAGYRPGSNWLGMAQLFVDAPLDGRDALRAQLTLVHFGEEGRGLQVGIRGRIDGEEVEPALVIAVWGRPGG
ncbi:MAG: hypothetical protein R3C25_10515 [Hyphomonadaceae bacterium]